MNITETKEILIESQERLGVLQTQRQEKWQTLMGEIAESYDIIFRDACELVDDVVIKYDGKGSFSRTNYVTFYQPVEGYGLKEIFQIYERKSHISKDAPIDIIELNYYTTTTVDEFEFKRLGMLGRVAQYILENKAAMLELANENDSTALNNPDYNELDQEVMTLSTAISTYQKELKETADQDLIDAAYEGITFNESTIRGKNWNRTQHEQVQNITKFKILKETKTTCDVEVETANVFNLETRYTNTYHRAKKEYILDFLRNHIEDAEDVAV